MVNRKAIYTVLIGNYDTLKQAPTYKGWDCFLLTDFEPLNSKGWKVIKVYAKSNKKLESRRYKILSHRYLPDYDLVCYIDASMNLINEPPSYPVRFTHKQRNTIEQEAMAIIRYGIDNRHVVSRQIQEYRKSLFKDNLGLFQNGLFVRSHDEHENELHESWFMEVEKHSYRDQLSLPFALFTTGYRFGNIQTGFESDKYIYISKHLNKEPIQVNHITPARGDKNLGYAINQLIENLPDKDWICLRDLDTFPFHPTNFISQCEEIARTSKFDLIGGMTNRTGMKMQQIPNAFELTDIVELTKLADSELSRHGSKVYPMRTTIAGFCMLFSKSIWKKAGGFREGAISIDGKFFDYHFSRDVIKAGGRIGIAKGMCIFHLYRLGKDSKNIDHLL